MDCDCPLASDTEPADGVTDTPGRLQYAYAVPTPARTSSIASAAASATRNALCFRLFSLYAFIYMPYMPDMPSSPLSAAAFPALSGFSGNSPPPSLGNSSMSDSLPIALPVLHLLRKDG
jgi:hypothetical protein